MSEDGDSALHEPREAAVAASAAETCTPRYFVWVSSLQQGHTDKGYALGQLAAAFRQKSDCIEYTERHVIEPLFEEQMLRGPPFPMSVQRRGLSWEYSNRCGDPYYWAVERHPVKEDLPTPAEQAAVAEPSTNGVQVQLADSAEDGRELNAGRTEQIQISPPRSVWTVFELKGNDDSSSPEGKGVLGVFRHKEAAWQFAEKFISDFWSARQQNGRAENEKAPERCQCGWTFKNSLNDEHSWEVEEHIVR